MAQTANGNASGLYRCRHGSQLAGIDRGQGAAVSPTDRAPECRTFDHHGRGSRALGATGWPPPCLAPCAGHCPAGCPPALASTRIPLVLAVEVASNCGSAVAASGNLCPDQGDGHQQSSLGRRAHPWRTPQARHPRVQAHQPEVSAGCSSATSARTDLDDLPP